MQNTKSIDLTAERLRDLLSYDAETGIFTWRVAVSHNVHAGAVAGTIDKSRGYRKISIGDVRYLSHRLAWLYVHGVWPTDLIDHANGVRDDNRLANLREATRRGNAANSRLSSNNTSGLKGVRWHKRDRKWHAQINVGGRTVYLGSFNTKEAGHQAYMDAARQQHGEFASDGRR
jgi:hypothetical protein